MKNVEEQIMQKKDMIIPSMYEIIEINRKLGYKPVKEGALDFILAKIRSRKLSKDIKKDVAKGAVTLWYEIIVQHPFVDGNKRTAAEAMQLFLEINGFKLEALMGGLIYMSMKIANNDVSFSDVVKWTYDRLEVKK